MFRDFRSVMKDMTVSSVHTPTTIGNIGRGKAKGFKAVLADAAPPVAKRDLQPNADGATAKSPFVYDPNALSTLRPDQVPRFFGALTDSDKLPVQDVKLADLHAMQDRVDPAKVTAIAASDSQGKLAVVVGHNGKHYIADGHHRLSADWLAGKETASVHFKDLEPVDQALKRAPDEAANFRIAKVDDALGLVFGWAIVCKVDGEDYYDLNVDREGPHAGERVPEHIPEDVMTKAALGLAAVGAPGNEMHEGPDKGFYPFLFPLTTDIAKAMGIQTEKTGLMCAFKPPADVLAKFKSGIYRGFSIEGRRVQYTEHSA
jgi:hypothetical protein